MRRALTTKEVIAILDGDLDYEAPDSVDVEYVSPVNE